MPGRAHRLRVRHKVWLDAAGRFALGDGGIELLRAIDRAGSVRAAAREVGWSYRHTLAYLANSERAFGYPLVERARGGHERGGCRTHAEGPGVPAPVHGLPPAIRRRARASHPVGARHR